MWMTQNKSKNNTDCSRHTNDYLWSVAKLTAMLLTLVTNLPQNEERYYEHEDPSSCKDLRVLRYFHPQKLLICCWQFPPVSDYTSWSPPSELNKTHCERFYGCKDPCLWSITTLIQHNMIIHSFTYIYALNHILDKSKTIGMKWCANFWGSAILKLQMIDQILKSSTCYSIPTKYSTLTLSPDFINEIGFWRVHPLILPVIIVKCLLIRVLLTCTPFIKERISCALLNNQHKHSISYTVFENSSNTGSCVECTQINAHKLA